MASIAGKIKQNAANTVYLAKGEEVFNRPKTGDWTLWTEQTSGVDGKTLEIDTIGPSPIVRELLGSRRYASLRAYAHSIRVKPYSTDALELSRADVELDKQGSITKRLVDYLNANANFWEKIATDVLLSNPIGVDNVALLSDSHPYGSGGAVWDNNTSDALSPNSFQAGITAMSGLLLENGEPAMMYPTHLVVGPSNEKMAKELTMAMRPFPIAATGLEAYSSVLAATTIENYVAGQITPVISRRLVGTYANTWYLMDLSKPGVRPVILGEAIAPMAVSVTDPQSEPMLSRSKYAYYVEAYGAVGGFMPHCIYGRAS